MNQQPPKAAVGQNVQIPPRTTSAPPETSTRAPPPTSMKVAPKVPVTHAPGGNMYPQSPQYYPPAAQHHHHHHHQQHHQHQHQHQQHHQHHHQPPPHLGHMHPAPSHMHHQHMGGPHGMPPPHGHPGHPHAVHPGHHHHHHHHPGHHHHHHHHPPLMHQHQHQHHHHHQHPGHHGMFQHQPGHPPPFHHHHHQHHPHQLHTPQPPPHTLQMPPPNNNNNNSLQAATSLNATAEPFVPKGPKKAVVITDPTGKQVDVRSLANISPQSAEGGAVPLPSGGGDEEQDTAVEESQEPEAATNNSDQNGNDNDQQSSEEEPDVPILLDFEGMLRLKELWDPRIFKPSEETVGATLNIMEFNKEAELRFYKPNRGHERDFMFGGCVTNNHDIRDSFANKSENPFSHRDKEKETDNEKIMKLITKVTNVISDENYDTLIPLLLQSNLDSACQNLETLKSTVAKIFDKAVTEKLYAHIYGRLCKDVCQRWAAPSGGKEGEQSFCTKFRRQLLNQCQEEFERGTKLQKELLLIEDVEERELKEMPLRKRTLANMKFVGELFKHNLITERIMHQVMFTLLFPETGPEGKLTDEGLELFCELMDTVGKQLDRPKAEQYMTQYFNRVQMLSSSYKTARVRFKLQNLLELRARQWVHDPTTPTTPAGTNTAQGAQQQPPAPAAVSKKVMVRPGVPGPPQPIVAGGKTMAQHVDPNVGGVRPAVPTHGGRPNVPMPTPVDSKPMLSLSTLTKKEWEDRVNEDVTDVVDMLKSYDLASRKLFVEKCLDISCTSFSKGTHLRKRFGSLLGELVKNGIITKPDAEAAISRTINNWVESDTVSDVPRLWECWAEVYASIVDVYALTESIANFAFDSFARTEGVDVESVLQYMNTMQEVTQKHFNPSSIAYFRTANLAAGGVAFIKSILERQPSEPGLKHFEALLTSTKPGPLPLDDVKDTIGFARAIGVVMSFLFMELKPESNTIEIVKLFKKIVPSLTKLAEMRVVPDKGFRDLIFQNELTSTVQAFKRSDDYRKEFEQQLQKNKIIDAPAAPPTGPVQGGVGKHKQ